MYSYLILIIFERFIWPIDGTLTGIFTEGQSGPGNEGGFHSPLIFRTGTSMMKFNILSKTPLWGNVMINKISKGIIISVFDSHWELYTFDFVLS